MNGPIAKENLTVLGKLGHFEKSFPLMTQAWHAHNEMPGTNETGLLPADNRIEALNRNGDRQAEMFETLEIGFSDLKDESPSVKNREE
jgi:hypothetical protein